MEVRSGYKQTEVGVIPEDWSPLKVADLGKVVTGGTPRTVVKAYWNGDFPWITPTDISGCRDMWSSERSLTQKGLQSIRGLPGDTVLVTCIASIGKNAILKVEGGCNQQINAVIPNKNNNAEFLYYLFEASKQYLLANAGTTATSILSKAAFQELLFAVPPLSEQRTIAGALGDVDALLGGLERLIAKKSDLKKAAMQQLLTGQTRLPGFNGEWEVNRLGDIAHINMGQSPDSRYYNRAGQGIPLIQGNADIENHRSINRVWTTQVTKRCDEGDLLLTVRAPVGAVGRASMPSCIGRGVCSLKPKGIDQLFLFHALVFSEPRWKILEQGSTFTAANSDQVAAFSLSFAPSVPEQTAIAAVLSDMDAEIAALEKRLAKTRALKQGMMQELLTGRVRLI
jgi:type I restriction enzyme S subunit